MNLTSCPSALESQLQPVLRAERESRMRRRLTVMLVLCALAVPVFAWWSLSHGIAPRTMWLIVAGVAFALEIAIVISVRRRRLDLAELARRIETEQPGLDGALLAAMELPAGDEGRLGFLQSLVLAKAAAHGDEHDWVGGQRRRELRQRGFTTLSAVGLFALSLFGTATFMQHAGSRAAMDSTPKPDAVITAKVAVTPGNAEVERGSRLIIEAKFENRVPGEASVVLLGDDGLEQSRIEMKRTVDDKVFGGVITDIAKDSRYRVQFDDGKSETFRITTFEYPRLVRVDATLTPPAWTEQPKTIVKNTMNVGVLAGSRVDFSITVNKPLAAAELFGEDKTIVPLKVARESLAREEGSNSRGDSRTTVYEGGFVPVKSQKYRVHLVDDRDRANKNPPWITVRVLPNVPPKIELTFPKRDLAVSPVQELPVEGKVWDDLGVLRAGVTFTIGGQTREVLLGDGALKGGKSHVLKTLFELEPVHAKPNQLLSYYMWAEDRGDDGKTRRTMSDMFFADVRSFEDIFREAEAPPGEDKEEKERNGGDTGKLLELQKQVVNATWRVLRNSGDGRSFDALAPDVKTLDESQQIVVEKAKAAIEKAKDAASRGILTDASKAMERAVSQFNEVSGSKKSEGLTTAMGSAREALEILYRAQAKEHKVMRGKQSKGGGGREQQNQRELANLEMKQEERRYEEQKEAGDEKTTAEQQENLQVLNRLKELASRQEALAQKMKEIEQQIQNAKSDAERKELDRQLKRLQEEQEQLLRDMDSLKERMEKPENVAQMSEMNDKLQQAREEARQAAEQLSQQQAAQATASATKSQRQLEEVRDEFRQKTAKKFAEDMRGLKEQARKLEEDEKKIADALEKSAAPKADISGDTSRQLERAMEGGKIARQLEEQQKSMDRALEAARKISEAAEAAEPALSSALYDAARKAETGGAKKSLEDAQALAANNNLEHAQEKEAGAAKGVSEFKENIERAAEKVLGSETEALRMARAEIDKLMKEADPSANGEPKVGGKGEGKPDEKGEAQGKDGAEKKLAQNDGKKPGDPKGGEGQGSKPEGEKPDGQQPKDGQGKATADAQGKGQSQGRAQREGKDGKPQEGDAKGVASGGQPKGGQPGQQPQPGASPQGGKRSPSGQEGGDQAGGNDDNNNGGGGGGWFFNSPVEVADNNPFTGGGYDNWSDRLRRVEELLEAPELRNEAAHIRDDARQMRLDHRRNNIAPQAGAIRTRITAPLAELRDRVNEELARRESVNPLAPLDRDPVPVRYRELVRRYYTELGAGN